MSLKLYEAFLNPKIRAASHFLETCHSKDKVRPVGSPSDTIATQKSSSPCGSHHINRPAVRHADDVVRWAAMAKNNQCPDM